MSGDDGDLRTVHVSDNTSENGSAPVVGVQDAPLEPSVDAETLMPEKNGENTESYHQQIFTEVASQNSGIPNEYVCLFAFIFVYPMVAQLKYPFTILILCNFLKV